MLSGSAREVEGYVVSLAPIFFRWLQGHPGQTYTDAFEKCFNACCGMSLLLNVTGFRSAYAVLAAVLQSVKLGDMNDDPEKVPCLSPEEFIYPARPQQPLQVACADLTPEMLTEFMDELGTLAVILLEISEFASEQDAQDEAWWLFDIYTLVVGDLVLVRTAQIEVERRWSRNNNNLPSSSTSEMLG